MRPTIFFGVPRVWEKFFTAVNAQLPPELKGNVGALPDANKAGIRAAIGLDNARLAVSGAAPISKKILDFFHALGITIREVYGMSEVTGPTSFNSPDRTKLGTVGPAFPGVEVKIAEDGEVCGRPHLQFYFSTFQSKDPTSSQDTTRMKQQLLKL